MAVRAFFVVWLPLLIVLVSVIIVFGGPSPLLLTAVFVALPALFPPDVNGWSDRRFRRTTAVLLTVMLLGLLAMGRVLLSEPFNDAGTIYYSTAEIVRDGAVSTVIDEYSCCAWSTGTSNNDYFLIYPKSVFLLCYLLPFMKLAQLLHIDLYAPAGWYSMIVVNCVSIAAAAAIGSRAVNVMKGRRAALYFLLLSIAFLPNYLNTYKVYSDTLSMPYVAAAVLFVAEGDRAAGKKRMLLRGLAGLSLGVGALLKGSVLVLAVAVIIWLVLRPETGLPGAVRAADVGGVLLVLAFVMTAWARFSDDCPWLDQRNRDAYELPTVHWVMMSAVGVGGYRQDALDYALSFDSYAERAAAETMVYTETVKSYGLSGYIHFIIQKLCLSLSDGRYYQQGHMSVFAGQPVGELVCEGGRYYSGLTFYLTGYLYLLYFCFILSAINALKRRGGENITTLFSVCFFGLLLFFAFWEFKSRYLMNYTPVFLMNAAFVLSDFELRRKGRA